MKDRNKIMRFFGLHPQNDVRRRFAFTLAEGATHVDNSNNKRKFAFTLAEVLVTLGIIGVVAVLTVPNIISSYQKKVYVAQLQKAYNQLQQVFDLAMADDEVEYLADTELMQSMNGPYICFDSTDRSEFVSKLGEYMKIHKACNPMDFSEGCHNVYYFDFYETGGTIEEGYSKAGTNRGADLQIFTKDGMIYYFHPGFGIIPDSIGFLAGADHALLIDVNGVKGPNKLGRDTFQFAVDQKGNVLPVSVGNYVTEEPMINWDDDPYACLDNNSYGYGCAARIMDQGWVMDY